MSGLLMSVTDTAKYMGLKRATVGVLCRRGEIEYVPAIRPDGTRSRIHKKVVRASADAWIKKNAVRSPDDLKKAVDGRTK